MVNSLAALDANEQFSFRSFFRLFDRMQYL